MILGDHEDLLNDIMKMVEEHNTKEPFYGKSKTLHLKLRTLTTKQRTELLDKKQQGINVVFRVKGMYEKEDGGKALVFRVTGLRRLENKEEDDDDVAGDFNEIYDK